MTLCCLWNPALLISPIGNKFVRHNCKKSIWKVYEISIAIYLSILVTKRCLCSEQAISLCTVMNVCVGYSCVINQWHSECDPMQWDIFVPVFHTDMMQAAGYCRIQVDCVWNMMAHVQKPDFIFQRNGPVHKNRRGHQFSRLLAAKACTSAVVMLDITCSEVVWRVLAAHYIRLFPPSLPLLCITMCHRISAGLYYNYMVHTPADHNENTWWCESIRYNRAYGLRSLHRLTCKVSWWLCFYGQSYILRAFIVWTVHRCYWGE